MTDALKTEGFYLDAKWRARFLKRSEVPSVFCFLGSAADFFLSSSMNMNWAQGALNLEQDEHAPGPAKRKTRRPLLIDEELIASTFQFLEVF